MEQDEIWDETAAAQYDTPGEGMFAPEVIEPTVAFLADLAGDGAALEFAKLGYQVKEMIGGFEYWAREGYPVEDDNGPVFRAKDPLTAPLDAITCDC